MYIFILYIHLKHNSLLQICETCSHVCLKEMMVPAAVVGIAAPCSASTAMFVAPAVIAVFATAKPHVAIVQA